MTIPIFIISLEKDKERLQSVQAQLEKMGLNGIHFPAVDGRKLNLKQIPEYDELAAIKAMGRSLLPSEIGCYLSHINLLRQLIQDKAEAYCILEDDVIIAPEFADVIKNISKLPSYWEFLRIEGISQRRFSPVSAVSKNLQIVRLKKSAAGTAGYIINKKGAHKILRYGAQIIRPIDNTIDRFWENNLDILAIQPYPVKTNASLVSTISNNRNIFPYKGLGHRLRRLKDSIHKRLYVLFKYGII